MRKPVNVMLVAAVLLAALMPSAPIVICAAMIAIVLIVPVTVIGTRRAHINAPVQPLALRSAALLRAPPSHAPLV